MLTALLAYFTSQLMVMDINVEPAIWLTWALYQLIGFNCCWLQAQKRRISCHWMHCASLQLCIKSVVQKINQSFIYVVCQHACYLLPSLCEVTLCCFVTHFVCRILLIMKMAWRSTIMCWRGCLSPALRQAASAAQPLTSRLTLSLRFILHYLNC